jgi:uncharacterized LabA/DUF88 family protein
LLRVAVLIDGGHLRALARKDNHIYDPDFIEKFGHACVKDGERLHRILYYDCAPYSGTGKLPVSGEIHKFEGSDDWLKRLAERDQIAVRRGVLKFRGFKPKKIPIANDNLSDDDFRPDFKQKGVDMRIGLDMASLSTSHAVERIVLVTGDTDCLPAMKHARVSGLQVVIVSIAEHRIASELLWHSDFHRKVEWPA